MHKLLSFVSGTLLGLGLALILNIGHDLTIDQSAKIAEQGERIQNLENGILRHLCVSAEIGDYVPSEDLILKCKRLAQQEARY